MATKADPICNWVKSNNVTEPVQLEIELVMIVPDRNRNGRDARYFNAYINGANVTQMVANATGLKVSKAKRTYGSLILHGCGMDMAFDLQNRMYSAAYQAGYPKMFDMNNYRDYKSA